MKTFLEKGTELLARLEGKKVLVIGDLMIDEYIWGGVTRISPEAPVPIVGVTSETLRPGGAANVASNIFSLKGKVELCGVLGDDQMGRWLKGEMGKKGTGTRGIISVPGRPTTVKTRVIAHNQQVVRVDKEVTYPLDQKDENLLLASAGSFLPQCGCVVISDYAKGVITPTLVRQLVAIAGKAGVPVAVDPKVQHFSTYRGVSVLTPNLLEAAAGAGMVIDSMDALVEAGRRIVEKLGCAHLLITRGDQGMTLFSGMDEVTHIPALGRHVFDVTGAGDTVISTLSLAMAAGLPMADGAYLSNVAAGIVVGEVGTVAVTVEQMQARFREIGDSSR
ncbi:MAG: D-glycero-beta-D-manno-heptose-7-phosphate kinase [bacterium]|nr:D-glycero-beta-D-manno-heptose-7-phosphate kinase [bacterium]MDT8396359.1 D-glycero-beta-D-manno-heptose-7-phosphate kinase [bacterium]